MGESQKASKTILARTVILMILFGVVAFIPLGLKLYSIQIERHDELEEKAVRQQTRSSVITPNRGTIYDRNLNVLAASASAEVIFLDPNNIKTEEKAKLIAQGLSSILGIDYDKLLTQTGKKNRYEIVMRKVEKDKADEVREFILENSLYNMVGIDPDSKRYYPNASLASTLIGFVGIDNNGLEGLEAMYEKDLTGIPGQTIVAKDRAGSVMPNEFEMYYDATDGQSLVLTIDESIQHFLEKHLETAVVENEVANKACGIVMDVKTGGILAMTTKTDYDLNNPRELKDASIAQQLSALEGTEGYNDAWLEALQQQWRNKAVSDTYEPGSTFKIFTAAMAIEENVISESDRFSCAGSVKVGKWTIGCHNRNGHGSQTFLESLLHSCNPAFIAIANRVGDEKFYQYMNAFGFMEKTDVDMPGEVTSYSALHASWEAFHRDAAAQAVYAFGQTFKITPLQLITAVSAVANGGYLMKPFVVQSSIGSDGAVIETTSPTVVRQVVSRETSQKMCEMLEECVIRGTGTNAYVKGYRVAGKTGTSQKRDIVGAQEKGLYVTSFVGFAPADDPQIAVLIMLDEPGGPRNLRTGGYMAAPVARRVLADALPYLGVTPQYTAEEVVGDVETPSVKEMTVDQAKQAVKDVDLGYTVVGEGETVVDQIPAAGVKIPMSAKVILYTEGERPQEKVTVPDVTGKTPEQANTLLASAGLYMKAVGAVSVTKSSVTAAWQEIVAGTEVAVGTVVQVEFRDGSIRDDLG